MKMESRGDARHGWVTDWLLLHLRALLLLHARALLSLLAPCSARSLRSISALSPLSLHSFYTLPALPSRQVLAMLQERDELLFQAEV